MVNAFAGVAIAVIDSVCPSRGEPSSLTIQSGTIARPVVAAVESTPPAAAVTPAAAQPEPSPENASDAAQDGFDPGIDRLRSATWWEADRKLRPQLAQVGDLMFVATLFEGETGPSAEGASHVQRLRDAMRAHRQLKPAGWNRLVEHVDPGPRPLKAARSAQNPAPSRPSLSGRRRRHLEHPPEARPRGDHPRHHP